MRKWQASVWPDGRLHVFTVDAEGVPADVPRGAFVLLRFWSAPAAADETGEQAVEPAPPPVTELTAAEVAEIVAARLKAECRRRIEARLDDRTAQNLLAARLRSALSAAQVAAFDAADEWKLATITECRRAIAGDDDPAWPEWPGGAADALVAAF